MQDAVDTQQIAEKIDHTFLKPEATTADIERICNEALANHFFGVCVNSVHVPLVSKLLQGSPVKTVSVIGFPLGACHTDVKVFECGKAIDLGADEIDMVLSIGHLKEKSYQTVEDDISAVVREAWGRPVKVIIETNLLSKEEKIESCKIINNSGARFIKTNTGFFGGGATFDDIRLFKEYLAPHVLMKASGGIKNLAQAKEFIRLGVARLGTSAGVQIIRGQTSKESY